MTGFYRVQSYIERVCQRPLPRSGMTRTRVFARELAEGASEGMWAATIHARMTPDFNILDYLRDVLHSIGYSNARLAAHFNGDRATPPHDLPQIIDETLKLLPARAIPPDFNNLMCYVLVRWGKRYPDFSLLAANDYITYSQTPEGFYLSVNKAAFDLLESAEPSRIFISYRRAESSAFALLVLARLKEHGLDAFLDMSILPGEDWHADLKRKIESRDYFIVILGRESLRSRILVKEIQWAMQAHKSIIPIWHNAFVYRGEDWHEDISPDLDTLLQHTHTIRVLEESALAYNDAIVQLLNRFGITP